MSDEPIKARIKQRSNLIGSGCALQAFGILFGILCLFFPPIGWFIGPIAFICFMIWGSRKSLTHECTNCRNPVANKRVRLCPSCGAHFK